MGTFCLYFTYYNYMSAWMWGKLYCKMKFRVLGFEAKMGPYLGKCNLFALHLQIANKQKAARGTKNVDKFIWHKNRAGTSILFSIIAPYLFFNEFTSWSKHLNSFSTGWLLQSHEVNIFGWRPTSQSVRVFGKHKSSSMHIWSRLQ